MFQVPLERKQRKEEGKMGGSNKHKRKRPEASDMDFDEDEEGDGDWIMDSEAEYQYDQYIRNKAFELKISEEEVMDMIDSGKLDPEADMDAIPDMIAEEDKKEKKDRKASGMPSPFTQLEMYETVVKMGYQGMYADFERDYPLKPATELPKLSTVAPMQAAIAAAEKVAGKAKLRQQSMFASTGDPVRDHLQRIATQQPTTDQVQASLEAHMKRLSAPATTTTSTTSAAVMPQFRAPRPLLRARKGTTFVRSDHSSSSSAKVIRFKCPHCDEEEEVKDVNCGVFRHARWKNQDYALVDSHASKEVMQYLLKNGQVEGCGQPFKLIEKDGEWTAEKCDWV